MVKGNESKLAASGNMFYTVLSLTAAHLTTIFISFCCVFFLLLDGAVDELNFAPTQLHDA